ncbi:Tyrosine-protein phosphatase Lar-like [Holothuria leucospilota]|uniref:Tyrosine-protein phosphatase Lar-like n=1 Tax=Holothuria leucospilota TaxID=206669 RepID=A0A9Q1CA40_HOLLE|nr:Tyrosine-protein phosphatase Lar-like [Holothuria leucospilota]
MVLTICRLLVIGGVLLWKVLFCDSTRFIEEGKEFILHCPQVNSSNTANWSRNGRNLSELIGNLSYHVTSARFSDSGVYTCTRSGFVEVFDVKVGRGPTVHRTVCFNSSNTTILCTTRAGYTSNTRVCLKVEHVFLNVKEVEKQCNEGNVTLTLDLDEFQYQTFNFITTVTNPFGQRTKLDQFRRLGDKVIPHPPMYVEMYPDGVYSFNVSFTIPPSWKIGSKLLYSYTVTQDNLPSHHSLERPLVNLTFKIQVQRKPYSLVCLRIRLKYFYSDFWGEYSLPKCQRTTEAAPSTGPLSVAATSVQDILNPGYRNVTVTWEPPEERNRNGIIYQYSVTLKKETVEFTNEVDNYDALMHVFVNGNVTRCTLSGIPSYQPVNITLKAWTKMGVSPGTSYTLDPLPDRKKAVTDGTKRTFTRKMTMATTMTLTIPITTTVILKFLQYFQAKSSVCRQ